jgi:hypothetical protein
MATADVELKIVQPLDEKWWKILASYQVSVHLAEGFQRRRFKVKS